MAEPSGRAKSSWKRKLLLFAGLLVMLSLLGNPATMHLGLTLDAVGIDAFLMLLEVQLLAAAALTWERWGLPALRLAARVLGPLLRWPPLARANAVVAEALFWHSGWLGQSLAMFVDRLKPRMGE